MLFHNPILYNFTGLLNSTHRSSAMILCMLCVIICLSCVYTLLEKYCIPRRKLQCFLLCACMCLSAFTPFTTTDALSSQLHLLFALLSFLYLHRILFQFAFISQKVSHFYIGCLFLSGLFVITYQSITGISEIIFMDGWMISMYILLKSWPPVKRVVCSKAIRLLSPANVLRHWLFHYVMSKPPLHL